MIRDAIRSMTPALLSMGRAFQSNLKENVERAIDSNELGIEEELDDIVDAPHADYTQAMRDHANQVAFKIDYDDTVEEDEVTIEDVIHSASGLKQKHHHVLYHRFLGYKTIQDAKSNPDTNYFPAHIKYPFHE